MNFRLSHLGLLLVATTILAAILGVSVTLWVANREFADVLTDDLEQQSKLLAEILADRDTQVGSSALETILIDVFEEDDEDTLWVTAYDLRDGSRISNLKHGLPLDSTDDGPVVRHSFGYDWHGYQEQEGDVVVQVLRRDDRYKDVREDILEEIITPALIGSGVNILLLSIFLALTLVPLSRLVRELEGRSASSLEPISTRSPAREIVVLRDALNELMVGIDSVVARERQFANDVAHELRTPLTTLKLELANPQPDPVAIKAEVDRLARLVEQLLTLARLEGGKWQQRFDRLSLSDLVAGVLARFETRFRDRDMSLQSQLAPAFVSGDETLLDILLRNLLVNVLNHCPSGTRIDVDLEQLGDKVFLRVGDNGPGIPESTRRQMSRGFTRLDSRSDGFGIGLAICQKITDAHGGTITFSQREDGSSGLVVEVTLPA